MKNLIFFALMLTTLPSFAQKNEIGAGLGTGLSDRSFNDYIRFSHTRNRLQYGIDVDMQASGSYADFIAPNVFAHVLFPVKYGYFYTGGFLGYAHGWNYLGGVYFGGHAGVNINLAKHLAFNTELSTRIIAGVQHPTDPYNKATSSVFDMNADMPITIGLRYRF